MASSFAVGVFDSGVGGLSILGKIHELLPGEALLYVADSAHAPYGPQGKDKILLRAQEIMKFFLRRQVKAAVVACNTATAAAVVPLRSQFHMPIIGVEPAIKPSAQRSRAGVVGVLATEATIDSGRFLSLKNRFDSQAKIITKPCPGLVEQIERIAPDAEAVRKLLHEYIAPLLDQGADLLVLGCTHFSLIADLIADAAGPEVEIVDAGLAVAKELARQLELQALLSEGADGAPVRFFTSGDAHFQQRLISRYWGQPVTVAAMLPQP